MKVLAGWLVATMWTSAVCAQETPATKGFAVRVGDVVVPDYNTDVPPAPVAEQGARIVAAQGGTFSAKLVVTSDGAIRGLSVQVSDLKSDSGRTLPAAAVRIRYATLWGEHLTTSGQGDIRFVTKPGYLGLLQDKPPAEYPVTKFTPRRQPEQTFGPVAPVWLTVTVPREAAAGAYIGQVTVRAEGQPPVMVPLRVEIIGWTVPEPAKWRTWVEVMQSPDTLAMEYNVEPWSERHWALIARSLRQMRELGNRVIYLPLICRTNMGHAQSMVRWTKKADGSWSQDYSIMERYLDTVEKEAGRPQIVVLYAWENYMIREGQAATGAAADHEQERILKELAQKDLFLGQGPAVTTVDPATKKLDTVYLPHYTDAASKALWSPVYAEIKSRLTRRWPNQTIMLGMINDCWPTKEEVQLLKDASGGLEWVLQAHFGKSDVYGLARVGYRSQVWSLEAPGKTSLMGWKRPDLLARFTRLGEFGAAPQITWRYWGEYCIAGNQRGIARLGADFWSVIKDKSGRRVGRIWDLYPESSWRNLGIYTALLGPGPDGPEATPRLEMLREGVQECEARIAIESVLADPALQQKLPGDLAARCREALDERLARMKENPGNRMGFTWNLLTRWQDRSRNLYELAAEVARTPKLP
jgi:hypothetical protein